MANLVTQRAQGIESILKIPGFQRFEEVDDGVSDTQPSSLGQFLDAVGMKPGKQALFTGGARLGPAQNTVDNG
jgi:hypothetical protein